ncbi:hypothetical protein E2320_014387, partial [Naja naja]
MTTKQNKMSAPDSDARPPERQATAAIKTEKQEWPGIQTSSREAGFPRVMQVGTIGGYLKEPAPQEPEKGLSDCWEAQWQAFLHTMQSSHSGWGNVEPSEATQRDNIPDFSPSVEQERCPAAKEQRVRQSSQHAGKNPESRRREEAMSSWTRQPWARDAPQELMAAFASQDLQIHSEAKPADSRQDRSAARGPGFP